MSHTPTFDKAMNQILQALKPHERACKECGKMFEMAREDISFYEMFHVPPPTKCPWCRRMERWGHYLRMPKFFKRKCVAPGHTEEIVTVFPGGTPHKIYDFTYWHGDEWNRDEYKREYNPKDSFFQKFKELYFEMPRTPIDRDPKNINSDYSVGGIGSSNLYFSAFGYHSEEIMFSYDVRFSKNLTDCNTTWHSELCYATIGSDHLSSCLYSQEAVQCLDSTFLFDCRNCANSFLATNKRGSSYLFENKKISKKEYEERMKTINLGKRSARDEYLKKLEELKKKAIHRAEQNLNSSDCRGNYLTNCSKCYFAFRAENAENVRYGEIFTNTKDCVDITGAVAERCYGVAMMLGANNKFSMYIRNGSFIEYSADLYNCHNCFGCVGLKNKEFHIFNKPYSEDEYWKKMDEIKTAMLERGEYGEFFPLQFGLIPYQSSLAELHHPLSKEEREKKHIPWYDDPESKIPENMPKRVAPHEVPEDIKEVEDSILQEAIICEKTKKPFRITKKELDIYRRLNIPLPTVHPMERIRERIQKDRELWLYPFTCPKCSAQTWTTYNPEKQKELTIYCDSCYQQEVA